MVWNPAYPASASSIVALENERPTLPGSGSLTVIRKLRCGLLVGGRVRPVVADQPHIDFSELLLAAEEIEQHLLRPGRLLLDVQAGQDHGHGVAVAAEVVQRDLDVRRRGTAAGAGDRDPVPALRLEPDRVEVRDHVGARVRRPGDLVQKLRGDRAGRHQPAGAGVLGDHAAAVGRDLGDREARVAPVGQFGQERVVAAGGLRAALDHVPGHHRPGQFVEVGRAPAVPGRGRADDQRGVGDPRADHHVRPGPQRGGDAPAAEIGVRGDGGDARLGQRLAGVGVRQRVPGLGQLTEPVQQVVPLHVGDLRGQAEPAGDLAQPGGQPRRVEAARVDDDRDVPVQAGADDLLELAQERPRVARGGVLAPGLPQDEHGQLGQVVAGEHVDGAALDHLPRGGRAIAVETGAVGDPHRPLHARSRPASAACAASRPGPGRPVLAWAGRAGDARAGPVPGRRTPLRSRSSRTSPHPARSCG